MARHAEPRDSFLTVTVRALDAADETTRQAVIALWHEGGLVRPWNDPDTDLSRALDSPSSGVLIALSGDELAGTVMLGHDGHRGAVYYLAVSTRFRRQGIGVALMRAAEEWLAERGAPKLNLMIRPENAAVRAFYERCGYAAEERLVMGKFLN